MVVSSGLSGRIRRAVKNNSLVRNIDALRNHLYDFARFRAHSSAMNPDPSPQAFAARITKEYHRLEKGVALPAPRPGFAAGTVDWLLQAVPRQEARVGASIETDGARGALRRYVEYHDAIGQGARISGPLRDFVSTSAPDLPGGSFIMTRTDLAAATKIDFDRFARARFSTRQFTGAPVPEDDIRDAVATALKSPRVCNRESRRVRAGFAPEIRARMLSFQNGNRGFGDGAGAVLIISSDLRSFTDFGERNQAFVDGGLFAMTLAFALHAKGYGTCFLNWSAPFWSDRAMRRALGIPDNEVVVTFLAVGCLPDSFELAKSPGPEVGAVFSSLG